MVDNLTAQTHLRSLRMRKNFGHQRGPSGCGLVLLGKVLVELIIAAAAIELVVALPADEDVVATQAEQVVVALSAVKLVVEVPANQDVVAIFAVELGFPGLRGAGIHGNVIVAGAGKDGDRLAVRSEEHTSELQSHVNLVCRLLLEKKKISTSTLRVLYI